MRSRWGMTLLAALLASSVAGAALAAETVKVGVLAPFSGPFARWGTQFRQGIEVWQKQHGTSVDGIKIEVVYRDTGGPAPARRDRSRRIPSWVTSWTAFVDVQYRTMPAGNV